MSWSKGGGWVVTRVFICDVWCMCIGVYEGDVLIWLISVEFLLNVE